MAGAYIDPEIPRVTSPYLVDTVKPKARLGVGCTIGDRTEAGFKRWQAAYDTLQLEPSTKDFDDAAKALSRTLLERDADRFVRLGACGTLGRLGEKAGTLGASALALVLRKEGDVSLRRQAAHGIGGFGCKVGVLAQACLANAATQDPDTHVRWNACEALGRLGEHAGERGAKALALALTGDKDAGSRVRAAVSLGYMGFAAGDAGSAALFTGKRDCNLKVKVACGAAIDTVRQQALVELTDNHAHEYLRGRAARSLGGMGPWAGPESERALIRILLSKDEPVHLRRRCAEALGSLAESASPLAAAALAKLAQEPDTYLQWSSEELCPRLHRSGVVATAEATAEVERLVEDTRRPQSVDVPITPATPAETPQSQLGRRDLLGMPNRRPSKTAMNRRPMSPALSSSCSSFGGDSFGSGFSTPAVSATPLVAGQGALQRSGSGEFLLGARKGGRRQMYSKSSLASSSASSGFF